MNLVLIGYRGSGKSSVGRQLAAHLSWDFVDTDTVLARRAGQTIREIFAAEGEPGFRHREAAVIAEMAAGDRRIIAAGGGAILRPDNVAALRQNAKLIYLHADAETLWARIHADAQTIAMRPSLTPTGGLAEVRALLAAREPLYRAAADATVQVANRTVPDVAEEILRLVPLG